MSRSYLDPPLPIVALATPPGKSALAVLRTSGPGSIDLVASCFSRAAALSAAPGNSLVTGDFLDPASREVLDEVVVAVFRAPRSPTGEDAAELSCHGSPAVLRRILDSLHRAGFAAALPGEFSFRAFSNGKGDLVRAEAVAELVDARGEAARMEAVKRLGGGLSRRLEEARRSMLGLLAEAEVRLDYAEEDGSPSSLFPSSTLAAFRGELADLAATWRTGRLQTEGATAVIAGATNAGKSSIFNLLLREERALVSEEPGTTRDWIEAGIEIAGLPVRLIDTAGLREGTGAVEAAGIGRSRALAASADLVLCVVDAVEGAGGADRELLEARPEALRIWNKVDLASARPCPAGWIPLSATEGAGLPAFLAALESAVRALCDTGGSGAGGEAAEGFVIANPRQKALLDRAIAALDGALAVLGADGGAGSEWLDAAALELRDAADALGELTGEIASPEVLETIFAGFCLGK